VDKNSAKYLSDLAADFKLGEFPIQPWAEALTRERTTGAHASIPILDGSSAIYPLKIVQEPDLVVDFI
jgi:hypothetical protein